LPINARAYLYTIARNHLINQARRGRVVSIEAIAEIDDLRGDIDIFQAERILSARDELRHAKEGIDKLPPRCREVILLQKVNGLTDREAAALLGVSIETVRRQIKLGMKALFDHMAGGSGRIVRKGFRRRADDEALP
jgi:RNA polymerase sigma-70 factor (ECF subfamily)